LRKTQVFINLYNESHTTSLHVASELAETPQLSNSMVSKKRTCPSSKFKICLICLQATFPAPC